MTTRIVLKCDLTGLEGHSILQTPLMQDVLAAACYQQAIEEARIGYKKGTICDGETTLGFLNWIEQRAAELFAEKLR